MDQRLYRFYDGDGTLLYIGISMTPWQRFRQHRQDKPWWDDIRSITLEPHPDRASVLDAEAAAIRAEQPRHNIKHNRVSGYGPQRVVGKPARASSGGVHDILAVGDHVALGMADGECPVGRVVACDGNFVRLQLKDWISGYYWGHERSYRWDDVVEVVYADDDGRVIHDDHLATFQTRWLAS